MRLRQQRYGGLYRQELARITNHLTFTETQLQRTVADELARVLLHAGATVPFYERQRLPMPTGRRDAVTLLAEWPILRKDTVQLAAGDMLCRDLKTVAATKISTGGTSGRALSIDVSLDGLRRNYAFFERFKQVAGVAGRCKVATFAGRPIVAADSSFGSLGRRNYAANQLLLSSYHLSPRNLDQYVKELASYAPELIDSYPSSLEPIARHIVDSGQEGLIRPRAIITSSETLDPSVRTLIESAFTCRVFDHYGSAEMVALITQCPVGSYHVNSDFGYLEILREDGTACLPGEIGEIVATGFVNDLMPLVRYAMGDLASWAGSSCACGSVFPVIANLMGRMDDVVLTPDGRRIGRLDPIFKGVSGLHEARIVQEVADEVTVELVVDSWVAETVESDLRVQLALRLGNGLSVRFNRVDSIPRTVGGKLRMVENRMLRRIADESKSAMRAKQ